MIMRIQIAFRNVFRNRRRSITNILMIAGGITAIAVFRGFAHYVIEKHKEVTIQSKYGHLQVATDKIWDPKAGESPRDRAFEPDAEMMSKFAAIKGVESTSGRISFYGLINNVDQSVSAFGIGIDPSHERQMMEHFNITSGRTLKPDAKFEVILGDGLARQIGADVGLSLTALAYTYDGSLNAIDFEVVGLFKSGLVEIDNSTFYAPLATVQHLLDTNSIERLVFTLQDTSQTENIKSEVAKILPPGLSVRSWYDLSTLYRQVESYARVNNLVIDWILLVLSLLAIANTVGMSISERTGEIGTVRAIGDTRFDVFSQFVAEGLSLGFMGGIVGCIMGFITAHIITFMKIPIVIPGNSSSFPIVVDILPGAFFEAFVLSCSMAVLASLVPAFGASRLKIVEALKRNI